MVGRWMKSKDKSIGQFFKMMKNNPYNQPLH
jgi:hypothetical protein